MPHLAAASFSLNEKHAAVNVITTEVPITPPLAPKAHAISKDAAARNTGGVRVLRLDEYQAAALSLAEAFKEDHTQLYFCHTPDRMHWTAKQKWELHLRMMEYIVWAHLYRGLVVATGDNYDCVSLWMPPGSNSDDYLTLLRSGLWRLNYQLSREGRRRFFDEFLPLLTATKTQVLGARDPDSWYLVYIGTRPSGRGKGYARQAIEYVTKQADAAGQACYLESSAEVNQIIYGKLGFTVTKSIYLQRDAEHVQLDIMVREPKGAVAKKMKDEDADSGVFVQ